MSDRVTITEHVRFNDDGSSDHIKVVDGELFELVHHEKSPYFRLDPEISWAIFNTYRSTKTEEK